MMLTAQDCLCNSPSTLSITVAFFKPKGMILNWNKLMGVINVASSLCLHGSFSVFRLQVKGREYCSTLEWLKKFVN